MNEGDKAARKYASKATASEFSPYQHYEIKKRAFLAGVDWAEARRAATGKERG